MNSDVRSYALRSMFDGNSTLNKHKAFTSNVELNPNNTTKVRRKVRRSNRKCTKSTLKTSLLRSRALDEKKKCEIKTKEEENIKDVVEDILKVVVQNFPGVSQGHNSVKKMYGNLNDPAHVSQGTRTTSVTSSVVSKNKRKISNSNSSSVTVPSKISKNNIRLKSDVSLSAAIQDIPKGPRASKVIAKEKIYNSANARVVNEFESNTKPELKVQSNSLTKAHLKVKAKPKNSSPIREGNISGRRIIDFEYFLKEIRNLNNHNESGHCNLNDIIFTHEKNNGLCSAFDVMCTVCGFQSEIWTEHPSQRHNVNVEFVANLLSIKCTFKDVNKLLSKISLPVLTENSTSNDDRISLREKKKEILTASKSSNTATSQSLTTSNKNVDSAPKANILQQCTCFSSEPQPCKNAEDLKSVLIEDQIEIKEETDSEYEDESEVAIPYQTVNNGNEDKTYEILSESMIKQEIDSDMDVEDLSSSEMPTLKNVSNTDCYDSSEKIIEAGTHNNTVILSSDSGIQIHKTQEIQGDKLVQFNTNDKEVTDKEIVVDFDNQLEPEFPSKKAKMLHELVHEGRTVVNKSYTLLDQNITKQKLDPAEPKLDSMEATMNKQDVPFDANSNRVMTDQQTSPVEHINTGSNLCPTRLVNSSTTQIIPISSPNVILVPLQCLPQTNKVIGTQVQHNSAVRTYKVFQPQAGKSNAVVSPLQHPQAAKKKYASSKSNMPFILPALKAPGVSQSTKSAINVPVPSTSDPSRWIGSGNMKDNSSFKHPNIKYRINIVNKESTNTDDEDTQDAWEISLECSEKNSTTAASNQCASEVQILPKDSPKLAENRESTSSADEKSQKISGNSSECCEKTFETAVSNQYTPEVQNLVKDLPTLGHEDRLMELLLTRNCKVDGDNKKKLISINDIPRNKPIIEYKGKFLLASQFYDLHPAFNKKLFPHVMFYSLGEEDICIDSSTYGNEARFIRRSCKPNAELQHLVHNGNLHLFIYSTKVVFKDDEITLPLDLTNLKENIKDIECACEFDDCTVKIRSKDNSSEKEKDERKLFLSVVDDRNQSFQESNASTMKYRSIVNEEGKTKEANYYYYNGSPVTLSLLMLHGILPDGYKFTIIDFCPGKKSNEFNCIIRLAIPNKADALIWLRKFEKKSFTTWETDRTYNEVTSKVLIFKKEFHCGYFTSIDPRLTSCPSKLTISIKNALGRSEDIYIKTYPCQVTMQFNHNHPVIKKYFCQSETV